MVYCAVFLCKRRSENSNFTKDGISYHTFPKDRLLKNQWIKFCRKKDSWVPTRTSVICSEHFDDSCFESVSSRRKLIEGAKPTKFNCFCKESESNASPSDGTNLLDNAMVPSIPLVSVKSEIDITSEQISIVSVPRPSSDLITSPAPRLSLNPTILINYRAPSEPALSNPIQPSSTPRQLCDTPRTRKLKREIMCHKIKIKRLQDQNRYLKKKVNSLKEILDNLIHK